MSPSEFLQVLAAPYAPPPVAHPLRPAPPHPDHAARCRTAINWTVQSSPEASSSSSSPSASSSSSSASQLDQPIYQPHGRWAWTHGLSIDNPKQLLSLSKGAQCSASIDSGTIGDKPITYICRRWKTSKQKEWYGFYSELALYKSERYLRPLQGDVVPHIVGVHVLPESVSVTMELPHASFWMESSPSMPDALKERVIAAFEKIHARGVLHGDPELRHMLVGADGRVTIIDFGMSRAVREHPSLGIEKAEPEEFRLEMRKVKYKLDYMGARKREGDKVDDYVRRVRRNGKISELWRRRAKGERVGPIPQYEEDPEEDALDPPVNAQDFQEDWIAASDDCPTRVVVPGQSSEQVASQVRALLQILDDVRSDASPIRNRHRDDQENLEDAFPPHLASGGARAKDKQLCRAHTAHRPKKRLPKPSPKHSSPPQDDLPLLSAGHIEATSRRRDYIRHKHKRNTCISSLSGNPTTAPVFPASLDVPDVSKSLKPEDYRRIQESRRQAMVQYSRAPKGILKRRRDDGDGDELVDVGTHGSGKKLRFSERVAPPSCRGRASYVDLTSGRRSRAVCARAYRRLTTSGTRPELIDFTLPSLRTLSTLVGSLIPWMQ